MKEWTPERIAALSPSDRAKTYTNARRAGTDEGNALADMLRDAGLPFSEGGGISLDDPLVRAMEIIINSPEGKDACVTAIEDGWPPIAGVDSMLANEFTVDYGSHNMTTNRAGHLVAELMRKLGYKMVGKTGPTPETCIAKTGELWEKPSQGNKSL